MQNPKDYLKNKTILITGGTGSFGQAMTEKLLTQYNPKSIRVYSRDELKQHDMRNSFKNDLRLRFLIGDVRDLQRLQRALEGVDIVFHAAAMKQVPACEYNPIEAIRTNVDGAINVIDACLNNNVQKVVALSTDKAASPINLYGATKLCSDKLFIQANNYVGSRSIRFSVVRYGNVMGSRGSVIPLFRQQLKMGNQLTNTDKRMTRFWITLNQATDLVLSSLTIMQGGEIFVPKIPSMNMVDLALAMEPKADLKYIGIRPGEKIHEALITPEEGMRAIGLEDRYIIEPDSEWWKTPKEYSKLRVPEGFSYTSDNNTQWLNREQMQKLLEKNTH
ncbi:MAG: UDP-N-acetylglucosamine 4,6-dehydratase (inverting) [Patescibacteria group bacterium]